MTGVSVVIPTVGRPQLSRAIASVLAQDAEVELEILVVADVELSALNVDVRSLDPRISLLSTGGQRGGGYARSLGTQAARFDWIAYLDDDDEWHPTKLSVQLRTADDHGAQLVSCRHLHVDQRDRRSKPSPASVYDGDQALARYLFYRRRPGGGRASMYTSSLLCRASIAKRVDWDSSLRRHQDWDFLLRFAEVPDVTVAQSPETLLTVYTGSAGSISASSDWSSSMDWATRVLAEIDKKSYVDFLWAQTARYALAARDWRGVRQVVKLTAASKSRPTAGPVLIALAGLLPRRAIERLISIVH